MLVLSRFCPLASRTSDGFPITFNSDKMPQIDRRKICPRRFVNAHQPVSLVLTMTRNALEERVNFLPYKLHVSHRYLKCGNILKIKGKYILFLTNKTTLCQACNSAGTMKEVDLPYRNRSWRESFLRSAHYLFDWARFLAQGQLTFFIVYEPIISMSPNSPCKQP